MRLTAVLLIVGAVYVTSRLFVLFFFHPAGSDTGLYARYMYVYLLAAENHKPFYQFYRELILFQTRKEGRLSLPPGSTEIEYPPLSVAVLSLPAVIAAKGASVALMKFPDFERRYQRAFRCLCVFAEIVTIAVVFLLMFRLYGSEPLADTIFRAVFLCGAGLMMPDILYDRLDIILSAMVVLSLAALLFRSRVLSFIMFALAVNFKLVPVFLVPVWVLGSLRIQDFDMRPLRNHVVRFAVVAATRGAELCLLTAGVLLVFYLSDGYNVFDFVKYHLDRGVHVESVWGIFSLITSRLSDASCQVVFGYRSFNVITPITHFLQGMSLIALAGAIAGLTALLFMRCLRTLNNPVPSERSDVILSPQTVVMAALTFLCVVFCLSKAFSPQFLFCLVPLAALAPLGPRGKLYFYLTFAATACMSTLIYPCCYFTEIVPKTSGTGIFLLAARSMLLTGMTVFLAVRLTGALVQKNKKHFDHETAYSEGISV